MTKFPKYRPDGRTYCEVNIPLSRRVATLSALTHVSSIILLPCLYFYLWTKEILWPFLILYTLYSYVLDNTLFTGESIYRQCDWLKKRFIFRGFVDYFPIYTYRTVPLPASISIKREKLFSLPRWTLGLPVLVRNLLETLHIISKSERFAETEVSVGPNYMFTCHPHGVISFGITGSICWGGEDDVKDMRIYKSNDNAGHDEYHTLKVSKSFKSLFPGITPHLLTLSSQFLLPFYRDYIMGLGIGSVTKAAIKSILKRNHSVVIVIGGAHESLLAKPGVNRIVLDKRKGFVKIALEICTRTEADCELSQESINDMIRDGKWHESMSDIAIVPTYAFGENNIYDVYNTTEDLEETGDDSDEEERSKYLRWLLKVQLLLKKYMGFTIPLMNSRSIFNYDFGLLPYRRQVDVVMGEPIYIYRKFGNSVGSEVTQEEIDYYHGLYKERLIGLWEANKQLATEWDEDLRIVE